MGKTWTTKDGTKMLLSEMTESHIRNCIAMLRRELTKKPDTSVYVGDSEYAEQAVESENRINNEIAEQLVESINELNRELARRNPLTPVIQPEELPLLPSEKTWLGIGAEEHK